MMFGANQHNVDEWSTDDEGEYDEDEEDDEEDDCRHEDDEEEEEWENINDQSTLWEPQAKQYSPMNLKDQVAKARKESDLKNEALQDEERRLKLARKRAEKRKKQKSKKHKETDSSLAREEFQNILALANSPENIDRYFWLSFVIFLLSCEY
jgi:chromatin segregation and condensation protein Rec8/ScpA/Scc1 (kleisin family)